MHQAFKALKMKKVQMEQQQKHLKQLLIQILKRNRGFKVAGDQIKDDKSKDKTQYLGSTTSIKSWRFYRKKSRWNNTTTKVKEYKGKNLEQNNMKMETEQ